MPKKSSEKDPCQPLSMKKNDLPFDIPNNWVWVRLGDIGETNIGLTYDKSDLSNEGTIVLRSGNIQKGKIDLSDVVRVKGDVPSSKMCHKGDLLICARNGSKNLVGKAAIIQNEGFSFGAFMAIFRSNLNEYIYYFLSSPLFRSDFDGISTTTINQITQSNLRERLIPLPPLAEQQRIISKLAQILPQLERLQADENKLHAMQTAFPSRMKASLLQAAIEGKLTTQDPKADGTASDLLKQIQTEKQRLIDAKEIKRERPLPAIVDEEKPFDIPDNWEWVRLSQIGEIISGGTPKTTNLKYWQNGDIPWITPADMKNVSKYISKGARNITKAGLTSSSARLMPKGSVLFSSRAPIGYVAIAENEISTNQGFKSIVPFNFNLSEYLYFALMALANDIAKLGTGTTFKEVSGATVSNILIPLPPLAEQERIVAKLDALLPKVQTLNEL